MTLVCVSYLNTNRTSEINVFCNDGAALTCRSKVNAVSDFHAIVEGKALCSLGECYNVAPATDFFTVLNSYAQFVGLGAVNNSGVAPLVNRRNAIAIKKIVGYLDGNSIVENLNAVYVKKHLYSNADKPGTKNERLKRFKAMIRWGYEEELVSNISWLDKLKPFEDKEKKQKLEEKYLESDELKLVLENMNITRWRFLAELTAL
jgi:hypothetical protein